MTPVCRKLLVSSRHTWPAAIALLILAPQSMSASLLAHCSTNASAFRTKSPSVQRRSGEPKSKGPLLRLPLLELLLLSLLGSLKLLQVYQVTASANHMHMHAANRQSVGMHCYVVVKREALC
eukprot:GHRQ01029113.1.p1 GENE.GHRQ01029113.1~~GHRQ01029113.1.p1  ORF type:complete len:122 (+),score=16.89 GHRQ01029113.1:655-1020(+)